MSQQTNYEAMIYAIGDIHGNIDPLLTLLNLIQEDAKGHGINRPRLVVLGDFIDRGPNSRNIIELFLSASFLDSFAATILKGNHEDWLLNLLGGKSDTLLGWMQNGGAETIESYGVAFGGDSISRVFSRFIEAIPKEHIDFISSLPSSYKESDFFFVHAGVSPGIPLHRQHDDDLLWIDSEFLAYTGQHEAIIVHGHTPTQSGCVEVFSNRIAVDTGAGSIHGKLSAVVLSTNSADARALSVKCELFQKGASQYERGF